MSEGMKEIEKEWREKKERSGGQRALGKEEKSYKVKMFKAEE